jgi:IS5 family transposase
MTSQQRRWLRRRQAVEPAIGHLKSDNRMDRCWLQGALGDALHALSCAAGYNIRWLLRALARLGSRLVLLRLLIATVTATSSIKSSLASRPTALARSLVLRLALSSSMLWVASA